jgi:hypothetical protein
MSDDTTKKGPQDASKVNINEYYEIRYWCSKFNCTEKILQQAVKNVGVYKNHVQQEVERLKIMYQAPLY